MRTKQVSFAQPTSTTALMLGYGESGCWTVGIAEGSSPHKAVYGVETERKAVDQAHLVDCPWSFSWLFVNNRKSMAS